MLDLNGRRIQLKKSYAKWHLDHPEIYGNYDSDVYNDETYIHLAACFDVPIYGKIIEVRQFCYKAEFKLGKTKCRYYVERKHFTLL